MSGSTSVGRQGTTGTFQNTIAPKSAEQAMLVKQDEMIAKLNAILAAIAASSDGDTLQTALAAIGTTAIEAVKLVR
jgi:hypothetical protein